MNYPICCYTPGRFIIRTRKYPYSVDENDEDFQLHEATVVEHNEYVNRERTADEVMMQMVTVVRNNEKVVYEGIVLFF